MQKKKALPPARPAGKAGHTRPWDIDAGGEDGWGDEFEEPAMAPPVESWDNEEAEVAAGPKATAPDTTSGAKKSKRNGKKSKTDPALLVPGTVVLYWNGWRGVVRDAYIPLDEFWITDEETNELVRDESGEIVQFKSGELELLAPPPIANPRPEELAKRPFGGVLLLGCQSQMIAILQHFGEPNSEKRRDPQQLLAIPCPSCDREQLIKEAMAGLEPEVVALGKKLRPDLQVAVRSFHLQNALEKLGGDFLQLSSMYCLASVQLPYSEQDISVAENDWEEHWRKDVCNQVDLCVTATGMPEEAGDELAAARQALWENCLVELADSLWNPAVQSEIRRQLKLKDTPMEFVDANGMTVYVLIMPSDVNPREVDGLLRFEVGGEADEVAPKKRGLPPGAASPAGKRQAPSTLGGLGGKKSADASAEDKTKSMTANDWEKEQEQFAHLPELPANWIRVKSARTGKIYFFNKKTQQSQMNFPGEAADDSRDTAPPPLPPGWTRQVSKSNGKVYYWNEERQESTYVRPTR
eukprot:TRINITY_DN80610_c0_g1_i1.p1 TRINITY_DN80610_c0_g1~~TRINITY_DN80610_c0_g1_i1.p1  ORF type:complete len:524 (-),score=151.98 TRINITY_DN80610_c0_g1_i1:69-1640(-)